MTEKKWKKVGAGFNVTQGEMSRSDFLKEYTCHYKPSKSELVLFNIAKEYHDRCDSYDRLVCRRTDPNGEPMPTTYGELGEINKYAIMILGQLEHENPNIPKKHILIAIRRYGHVNK